jgi:ATP-binding cassette, subfamily B, bacterial PglK
MKSELSSIKELWGYLSPKRKKQFFALFTLMILGSFSEFVSIGLVIPFLAAMTNPEMVFNNDYIQPFIKFFSISNKDEILLPMVVLFGSFAIFSGALRVTILWSIARLSYAAGADFNINIYKKVLGQGYEEHISDSSSHLINIIITKTRFVVTGVIYPVLTILTSVFIGVVILILLLIVDPVVSLLSASVFGLTYMILVRLTRRNLFTNSKKIADNSTRLITFVQESLGGIRDIIIDSAHDKVHKKFRDVDIELQRAEGDNIFIGQSPKYLMESIGMASIAFIAYFFSQTDGSINQFVPILGVMALSAQRLLPLLQQVYFGISSMRGVGSSLEDVLMLLRKPFQEHIKSSQNMHLNFYSNIKLENIGFRYKGSKNDVFSNINLTINRGDCIGIIGDSGCGKSTLLDIIMGLLKPTYGNLKIDNRVVDNQNINQWRANIAHVPQSVFLVDDSIEFNIAFLYENHEIDKDLIFTVVEKAQLSDFTDSLPNGLQTSVGEMGDKLSGGQKQRIGLARAMYKNSDVYILDESTSALDTKTEEKIMKSINSLSKDKTVIMVAHRISTLKNCNKIYKLQKNQIKNLGSYSEAFANDK